MMVVRPVAEHDFDDIMQLAIKSGIGMTSLPNDEKVIESHINRSLRSFSSRLFEPDSEYYFFVLEDAALKKVVGCSAIKARAGLNSPLYSYKVGKITRVSHELNFRKDFLLLYLVNDLQGKTEIGTLFLLPEYRKGKNGLLLSRCRFLFMAQHRDRFTDTVFAEMRGISDEKGNSPFYESLGRRFFEMDFARADFLTAVTNKQFIADLMPRESIYLCLLSDEAQKTIGQPHQSTRPAMKILEHEGFSYNGYVDIFDAGPTILAPLEHIKTIASAKKVTIKNISSKNFNHHVVVATTGMDYRAMIDRVTLHEDDTVTISEQLAKGLNVSSGQEICISHV